MPYLGETLDSGMATLLAAETIEASASSLGQQPELYPGFHLAGGTSFTSPEFEAANGGGHLNGPIDDIQLRSWGIQLVDGRMPGFAAIVGAAKSNEAAVAIVRELQRRNILIFLSGNVNGRSIIDQLKEEGVEMGYDTYIVPFGRDTISAIYALGFATRSALTFGGMKGGQWRDILLYNKFRVFAFVLALGEVDDLKYAAAAGAINYGFPAIADTVIPQILPTGVTRYEHVISMPFNEIEAAKDEEKAAKLVQRCIEVRGVKIKMTDVPIPVPYGSAFEGEVVRKKDMRVEFGGKYSRAFEYLRMVRHGPGRGRQDRGHRPGYRDRRRRRRDGPGHRGRGGRAQDADRLRAGARAPDPLLRQRRLRHPAHRPARHRLDPHQQGRRRQGLQPAPLRRHPARPLPRRLRRDRRQGAGQDHHRPGRWSPSGWTRPATAYDFRNRRLADLTDETVDEFYTCTLCQSFAPNHVCLVSPQRLGLCGAYNWLDCKASFEINPTGPNQPMRKGAASIRSRASGRASTRSRSRTRRARCRKSPCTRS